MVTSWLFLYAAMPRRAGLSRVRRTGVPAPGGRDLGEEQSRKIPACLGRAFRRRIKTMGCSDFGVTQVLVGLHRVGIVGLGQALREVELSATEDRDVIVDLLLDRLSVDNYIPNHQLDDYKQALWREYLRLKGEDFSQFLSSIEVTVRGESGPARDRFLSQLESVFSEFELKPEFVFEHVQNEKPDLQLVIGDQLIVHGTTSTERIKTAVRKSFSEW
jgi:hypothetical protein